MTAKKSEFEIIDGGSDPGVLILETQEGGSTTVILSEDILTEKGVIALHVVGGSVYALTENMKLHKLDEVKGFPPSSVVREIKSASKPGVQG